MADSNIAQSSNVQILTETETSKIRQNKFQVTKYSQNDSKNESFPPAQHQQVLNSPVQEQVAINTNEPQPFASYSNSQEIGSNSSTIIVKQSSKNDSETSHDDVFYPKSNEAINTETNDPHDTLTPLQGKILSKKILVERRRSILKKQDSVSSQRSTSRLTTTSSKDSNTSLSKQTSKERATKIIDNIINELSGSSLSINKTEPHRSSIRRLTSVKTVDKPLESMVIQNVIVMHPEVLMDAINGNDYETAKLLIDKVKETIEDADRLKKLKRIRLKRLVKFAECVFLLFTFLMAIIVITNVILQIERIRTRYSDDDLINITNSTQSFKRHSNSSINKLVNIVDFILSKKKNT